MKKTLIFAAVAALTLGSCAKVQTISSQEMDAPIGFSAYSGNPITKAGAYDGMTTTTLQTTGFGVFAYQTTGDYPASNTTVYPNFMYNQQVSTASWTYSPIKYWPNQVANGDTDNQSPDAQATQADKVSFFAYAPYVAASTSGVVASTTEGITALSAYDATSDPLVYYKVSTNLAKQVDLLWGVSHGETWTNVAGTSNTPDIYKPYLNLQKPAIGTTVKFYFHHALAQLRVRAVAALNSVAAGDASTPGSREQDAGDNITKIVIEEVVLKSSDLLETGILNLNNDATVDDLPQPTPDGTPDRPLAKWGTTVAFAGEQTLTISEDEINAKLYGEGDVFPAASVPGVIYEASSDPGFDADVDVIEEGKYYTLIPVTPTPPAVVTFNVKVTYHVITKDTNLVGGFSSVENVISHDVTFNKLEAGKRYTIKMILGVSEVKFEAVVSDWETGAESEVYLPLNVA